MMYKQLGMAALAGAAAYGASAPGRRNEWVDGPYGPKYDFDEWEGGDVERAYRPMAKRWMGYPMAPWADWTPPKRLAKGLPPRREWDWRLNQQMEGWLKRYRPWVDNDSREEAKDKAGAALDRYILKLAKSGVPPWRIEVWLDGYSRADGSFDTYTPQRTRTEWRRKAANKYHRDEYRRI